MKGAVLYLAGGVASVVLHIGVGLALPVILAPEPIDAQPRPKSQVQIETQEVARSDAAPVTPDSPQAATEATNGAQLAQGAITQSRARPVAPPTEQAKASAPQEPVTAQVPPPQTAITASTTAVAPISATPAAAAPVVATAPPAAPVVATAPPAAPVVATAPPAAQVVATAPPAAQVVATAPPAASVVAIFAPTAQIPASSAPAATLSASAAPVMQAVASVAPAQAVAATAVPAPQLAASVAPAQALSDAAAAQTSAAPAIPPPAEHFTAALAFSGGAEAQIDAASLATIQSFMRPGDVQAQTDQVRDAMQTLLESVPCSRLQAQFNPETGSIELRGHVPEEGLRAPILAALQAQVGTGIRVDDAMLILPRPQCGALSGIGAVGLPQSTDQLTNPLLVGADAQERTYDYRRGDQMILDLAAPDYDAYIYVDFFDANGDVLHLLPNDTVPLTLHPAKSAMRIGAQEAGEAYLNITIGPPYGQEIAAAFAASAPLYDGVRPISEPAEPYLAWMADQVAAARAVDPNFKGEWVYFFVSTAE